MMLRSMLCISLLLTLPAAGEDTVTANIVSSPADWTPLALTDQAITQIVPARAVGLEHLYSGTVPEKAQRSLFALSRNTFLWISPDTTHVVDLPQIGQLPIRTITTGRPGELLVPFGDGSWSDGLCRVQLEPNDDSTGLAVTAEFVDYLWVREFAASDSIIMGWYSNDQGLFRAELDSAELMNFANLETPDDPAGEKMLCRDIRSLPRSCTDTQLFGVLFQSADSLYSEVWLATADTFRAVWQDSCTVTDLAFGPWSVGPEQSFYLAGEKDHRQVILHGDTSHTVYERFPERITSLSRVYDPTVRIDSKTGANYITTESQFMIRRNILYTSPDGSRNRQIRPSEESISIDTPPSPVLCGSYFTTGTRATCHFLVGTESGIYEARFDQSPLIQNVASETAPCAITRNGSHLIIPEDFQGKHSRLQAFSLTGRRLGTGVRGLRETVDLSRLNLPAGTVIMQIRAGDRKTALTITTEE
ncbi:MAG: hypothetical protein ACQEQV_09420 [Fibrobacterota bacterium]